MKKFSKKLAVILSVILMMTVISCTFCVFAADEEEAFIGTEEIEVVVIEGEGTEEEDDEEDISYLWADHDFTGDELKETKIASIVSVNDYSKQRPSANAAVIVENTASAVLNAYSEYEIDTIVSDAEKQLKIEWHDENACDSCDQVHETQFSAVMCEITKYFSMVIEIFTILLGGIIG